MTWKKSFYGGPSLKITVCELRNSLEGLAEDWERLVSQVRAEVSDLVLLPEMPFAPWPAARPAYDAHIWGRFVETHEKWLARLEELSPAVVLGSRPVDRENGRVNEGFVWDARSGYRAAHTKQYLPDEEGFWEASWYGAGAGGFTPVDTPVGKVGFLICTEMWFTAHAMEYARSGVQILACPRATAGYSTEKWKAGGVAAAVMSGAVCISSNRGGVDHDGMVWAGAGWVIEPEEGRLLGLTSGADPIVTVEVDLRVADQAKHSYPRYIYVD